MGPRTNPDQQPQQLFQEESVQQYKAQPELEAAILRFWDAVRKSADIIVTLRQENVRLQSRQGAVRDDSVLQGELDELRTANERFASELLELRTRAAEPLPAIDAPSDVIAEMSHLRENVSRAEEEIRLLRSEVAIRDEQLAVLRTPAQQATAEDADGQTAVIESLRGELTSLQERLSEAEELVHDHQMLTQQLMQVRTELETRAQLMQELQVTLMDRPSLADLEEERVRERHEIEALQSRLRDLEPMVRRNDDNEEVIARLEQELAELREDLDRAMTVIERYRATGLGHVEDSNMDGQIALFMQGSSNAPISRAAIATGLTKEEIVALADRLDNVALRIGGLFGIS